MSQGKPHSSSQHLCCKLWWELSSAVTHLRKAQAATKRQQQCPDQIHANKWEEIRHFLQFLAYGKKNGSLFQILGQKTYCNKSSWDKGSPGDKCCWARWKKMMAVVLQQKKKPSSWCGKRHQHYGPGAGTRMEMLRALPSHPLTSPMQGVWGYMVIAEG